MRLSKSNSNPTAANGIVAASAQADLLPLVLPGIGAAQGTASAADAGARPDFVERLSDWLGWTGAIELSAALAAPVADPASPRPPAGAGRAQALAAELQRLQARLQADIAAPPAESLAGPPDFAPWRRHLLGLQRAIETELLDLRQRLRQALATTGAPGARLAAIDRVMEQGLQPRQRSLLGLIPLRLQRHYEQLHSSGDAAWLQPFHADLQALMRAELAQQMLPLRGLLAALQSAANNDKP